MKCHDAPIQDNEDISNTPTILRDQTVRRKEINRRAADWVLLRCPTAAWAKYLVDTTSAVQFVRGRLVAVSREWRQPTWCAGLYSTSASTRRVSPGKYATVCSQTASAPPITYPA